MVPAPRSAALVRSRRRRCPSRESSATVGRLRDRAKTRRSPTIGSGSRSTACKNCSKPLDAA
eukprot:9812492-Alexandrium_andersonii.AAC.1